MEYRVIQSSSILYLVVPTQHQFALPAQSQESSISVVADNTPSKERIAKSAMTRKRASELCRLASGVVRYP